MRLTVLYDARCPLCSRFRDWLAVQPVLVSLDLVAAGSTEARQRFPGLDHARTLAEITVVADDGRLWTREHAWVVALWATASYRPLSLTLSGPAGLSLARAAAVTAAGLRSLTTSTPRGDAYSDDCAGTCHPLPPRLSRPGGASQKPRCGSSGPGATTRPRCGRSPTMPGCRSATPITTLPARNT